MAQPSPRDFWRTALIVFALEAGLIIIGCPSNHSVMQVAAVLCISFIVLFIIGLLEDHRRTNSFG